MLLCREGNQYFLPLIQRPANLGHHAGQVSLPGGLQERGEPVPWTALRELNEELGVPGESVQLVGQFPPLHVFVSNFLVTPFVGVVGHMPQWRLNAAEVQDLLLIPVEHLITAMKNPARMLIKRGPLEFSAPCIDWQGHKIWGATLILLGELTDALRCAT